MGRTVPSFRNVIAVEKKEWKPFRDALDKSQKKDYDEMWDIARLYVSACSNSVQLVPLHPIIISILFHHYKELKECISEVKQIEATTTKIQNKLQIDTKEEGNGEEEGQLILDSYLIDIPTSQRVRKSWVGLP